MTDGGDGTVERLRVFVSYSRDDLEFADQLVEALEASGFAPDLDRHGISGGEEWKPRLSEMIERADTVVFALSPRSATSPVCQWEIDETTRLGKRLLPIVCKPLGETKVPPRLTELNYIFFYPEPSVPGSGFGGGLRRLVTALRLDFNWVRDQTRYGGLAQSWQAGNRADNRLLSGADIGLAKEWLSRKPRDMPDPPALLRDFIKASEAVAEAKARAEDERARQLRDAELAAAKAREEAAELEASRAREAEAAARKLSRRTFAGLVAALVLAVAAAGAGSFAWLQWDEAGRQAAAADHERQLAEAASRDAKTQATAAKDALALAQTTMSETVDRFTDPQFLEDASLDPLQRAVLEKLAPLYLQLLKKSQAGDGSSAKYGEAINRMATLQSTSRSMEQATRIYRDAILILTSAAPDQPSADSKLILNKLSENLALQLLSFGDWRGAAKVLKDHVADMVSGDVHRSCIHFRVRLSETGADNFPIDTADVKLKALLAWQPVDFDHTLNQLACLIEFVDLYRYNNELEPAELALLAAKQLLDVQLNRKPRSVQLLLLDIRAKLSEARLRLLAPMDTSSDLLDKESAADRRMKAGLAHLEGAQKNADILRQLAPDSRLTLDADITVEIFRARLRSDRVSGSANDASKSFEPGSLTDVEFLESWLRKLLLLVQRDPGSSSLAQRVRQDLATTIGFLQNNPSVELASVCRRLLRIALESRRDLPPSPSVIEIILAVENCSELKPKPAVQVLEAIAPTRQDHRPIELDHIRTALQSALDMPPSATRLKSLRAMIGYLHEEARSTGDFEPFLRLLSDEAQRFPNSIRFTRLHSVVLLEQVDSKWNSLGAADVQRVLLTCPAYSEAQHMYCALRNKRLMDLPEWQSKLAGALPVSAIKGAFGSLLRRDPADNIAPWLLTLVHPQFVVGELGGQDNLL